MKTYLVFDQNTCEVVRAVRCSESQAQYQVSGPDEDMVEFAGDVDAARLDRLYVVGGQVLERPQRPTPEHTWNQQSQVWEADAAALTAFLELRRGAAQGQIDAAAGRARLRYITESPGQEGTYAEKWKQALNWEASGYVDPVPSYILAEAVRLKRLPEIVAQTVIQLGHLWHEVKGPEIESARVAWKEEIRLSNELEAIEEKLQMAILELGSI